MDGESTTKKKFLLALIIRYFSCNNSLVICSIVLDDISDTTQLLLTCIYKNRKGQKLPITFPGKPDRLSV